MSDPSTSEPLAPQSTAREEAHDKAVPTPAREAMKAGGQVVDSGAGVRFYHANEEWIGLVGGRSVTGSVTDAGAPLVRLVFYAAANPEHPFRETLWVGRDVSELTEEELGTLFEGARAFRDVGERKQLFAQTRSPKRKR